MVNIIVVFMTYTWLFRMFYFPNVFPYSFEPLLLTQVIEITPRQNSYKYPILISEINQIK